MRSESHQSGHFALANVHCARVWRLIDWCSMRSSPCVLERLNKNMSARGGRSSLVAVLVWRHQLSAKGISIGGSVKAERRRKFLRLATGAAVIPALPRVARAQT